GPLCTPLGERIVEREDRLGLVGADRPVVPAGATQREDFLGGDRAVGGRVARDLGELDSHVFARAPFVRKTLSHDKLKSRLPRAPERGDAGGAVDLPAIARAP